ncbi:F-box only protein 22 [Megalopta genalis]|uniref:F-box only protein 22 n=1 Tax=Megalopta genalis TaxID=115081 RepID=UPI0014437A68|nr:F-box only protein 22-like [Megalopta genalis]
MEESPKKRPRGDGIDITDAADSGKVDKKQTNVPLTYDILRLVFKELNGMELSRASMVCRSWLEAANDERRTRGPTYFMQNCKNLLVNEKWSMERIKTQCIKELQIKPALGLFFTARSVPFTQRDCHCKVLPPNCNTVTLGTHGVVFNDTEIEANVDNVVCTFLPEIPGVTIQTFVIGDNSTTKQDVSVSLINYIEKIREALDKPQKTQFSYVNSKCLLLFCDLRGREFAIKLSDSLRKRYYGSNISVWGGTAKNLLVCNAKDSENDRCGEFAFCVGITLTGAINTWSLLVNSKFENTVRQRVKMWRHRVRLQKHSIGLMFACFARGKYLYHKDKVESTIFKEIFPEVPLVGCFGDGEFGIASSLRGDFINEEWFNVRSTVFLIITYGGNSHLLPRLLRTRS